MPFPLEGRKKIVLPFLIINLSKKLNVHIFLCAVVVLGFVEFKSNFCVKGLIF